MDHNDNHPKKSRVEIHAKDYNKKKSLLKWISIILFFAIVAVVAYSAYIYCRTKNAVDDTYDNNNQVQIKKGEFNGKKKFAVLLMGTDTGALDRTEKIGNTDTIIIAVVNPQKERYTLMSVPRDTMAQMVGTKKFQIEKINAAYPLGGAAMSMASVSKLVNIPIKYYALVNMKGIMRLIRYVGGIKIRPTLSFEYGGYIFKKGQLTHMGGGGALAYSRMRYDDPQGDYGRQKRQRQVITTLIKKAVALNTLTKLDSVLTSISGNVKTNLPFDALQQIAFNYRNSTKNVKNDYLHGHNATIEGASYQVQSTQELQRVSDYLRLELGLEPERIQNNETYQNQRNKTHGFDFTNPATQDYNIYQDYWDLQEEGEN
ncbi:MULTISPECIES: LCP family protein [unclassified Lactobacillus]|uniref:LCP family glycopolymer transferase n=1 Tax=unclassified Lactobacillus TaxID=2620435 RepID=UPI000EFC4EE3|nr:MULTISPECIES: LCP family protein [unclassified Lactobacillus]RMC23685.1 LytR family transcriptional regulator [Lactobacillus sp. ESL0247]RMC27445.1 LytR family transcriptional regulator [Lactobacillus sp. ESL0246]RMC30646.1 LytR family transcriptional regulator [Lactobacillus sp. ESL0245]